MDAEYILTTNRNAWNHVAPLFHGRTALPEYGPLAPTESQLHLLDAIEGVQALELGCGSGHSLRYLADRGACEVWGVDLSPVQINFARETLRGVSSRVHLIESAMERDCALPSNHFDLVFSIYGVGWTTDLPATLALVARYLRAGGCFIISGEHPAYSCLAWNGARYTITESYFAEGPSEHASWKGKSVPTVIYRRTLGTFLNDIIGAGLQIEAVVETPLNAAAATDEHVDPARWYSVDRASLMPTTFIVKARKPCVDSR